MDRWNHQARRGAEHERAAAHGAPAGSLRSHRGKLAAAAAREEEPKKASEVYETPIENLDLSVRVFNSLKRTGITTVGEVMDMLEKGPDAMLSIRNFGEKSLDELKERLQEKGYLEDGTDPAASEGE